MPRETPPTVRTFVVLLAAAGILGWLPRLRRQGSIRSHVELLQKVAPIQQFAPRAGSTALFGRGGHFSVTIVAQRLGAAGARYELVPVDERVAAAWLA